MSNIEEKRDYQTLGARTTLKQSNYTDDYHIGQKVTNKGKVWLIDSINEDTKRLYHCIDKKGHREAFHSIDLKRV
jgi:hypothetical protein